MKPITVPKKLVKYIHIARDLNREEGGDVYHHPTENGLVKKCIDLSCKKPLTRVHTSSNKPKSGSSERWLEAYIIQLAKLSDNYKKPFKLVDKEHNLVDQAEMSCCFLYSQLKFGKTEDDGARPLDCLLYEPSTSHLIILELKATRKERGKAIGELEYYAKKVYQDKDELAEIFGYSGGVKAVEGYIVWPGNDKFNNKTPLDFGGWGLIGYSDPYGIITNGSLVKPWDQFKDYKNKLTIDFTMYRRSGGYQV